MLSTMAPFVRNKEALAEAVLLWALESERNRERFGNLVFGDARYTIKGVEQQQSSAGNDARHDLVLTAANGTKVFVELKLDASFTPRQSRALGLSGAGRPKGDARIDVLVLPAYRLPEVSTVRSSIARITWEEVDQALGLRVGRFADLSLGMGRFRRKDVLADARSLHSYRTGKRQSGGWPTLWKSLEYLRQVFGGQACLGRRAPGASATKGWYGGKVRTRSGEEYWLGWNFSGGVRGRFKACLVLNDYEGNLRPQNRPPLPSWAYENANGETFWDSEVGAEDVLDFRIVGQRLMRALQLKKAS